MITIKEVEHVAMLARLALTEEEKVKFADQMGKILDYFNLLNEVDTTDVEPMAKPIPTINVMREDVVVQTTDRDRILANAPEEEEGYFKVPKIID